MASTQHRLTQVRKPDVSNDQLTAPEVQNVPVTAADLQDFLDGVLTQLNRIIGVGTWRSSIPISLSDLDLSSSLDLIRVPFNYTTASPMILQAVTAGQLIDGAGIIVLEAFDDFAASVNFGTAGAPSLILPLDTGRVSRVAQFHNAEVFPIDAPEQLVLTVNPATSAAGSGVLFYRLR